MKDICHSAPSVFIRLESVELESVCVSLEQQPHRPLHSDKQQAGRVSRLGRARSLIYCENRKSRQIFDGVGVIVIQDNVYLAGSSNCDLEWHNKGLYQTHLFFHFVGKSFKLAILLMHMLAYSDGFNIFIYLIIHPIWSDGLGLDWAVQKPDVQSLFQKLLSLLLFLLF